MNRDEQTLDQIREATRLLISFAAGCDRERFAHDAMIRYAVLFAITVQGEAVKRLSDALRSKHPEIPWSRICGMRDRIIHSYDRVDLDVVWEVVTTHAPKLLESLDSMTGPEVET
jgi:uncharacterized protein with HEPN domain